jgi:hypothetical protein
VLDAVSVHEGFGVETIGRWIRDPTAIPKETLFPAFFKEPVY